MQYSSLWMVGISQPLNASTNITFVTHPKRLKRTSHLTQVCLRAHWVVILHEFASKDLKLLIFFLSVLVESDVRVNTSAAQVPVLWSAAEQVTNDTRQTAVEPVRTGHALQQIRYCERFAKGQAEVPEVLQKRVWRHRGHRHRIEGAHQAALLPVKRRARGLQRRAPPRISLHALWPVFRQIAQEDPAVLIAKARLGVVTRVAPRPPVSPVSRAELASRAEPEVIGQQRREKEQRRKAHAPSLHLLWLRARFVDGFGHAADF